MEGRMKKYTPHGPACVRWDPAIC